MAEHPKPPRCKRPDESTQDYRVAMGWDQPPASGEWRTVEHDGLPPLDGEAVFVGVNEAGFAACFNMMNPDGACLMGTAEACTCVMSCLRWWRVLDRPVGVPTSTIPLLGEWDEAERIRDLPAVDEALLNFKDDSTGDNATCIVRAVMRARGVTAPEAGEVAK